MKPQTFALLGLAILAPRGARAETCASLTLAAEPADLEEEVRRAFAERAGVDRCARVEVRSLRGDRLRLDVKLPDGRAASRVVRRREDVVPTLEALLLVPSEPEPAPSTRGAPSAPATLSTRSTADEPPREEVTASDPPSEATASALAFTADGPRPAETPAPAPRRGGARRGIAFEVAAAASGRAGDARVGAGVGAQAFLGVGAWLVGVSGRAEQYRATETVHMPALQVALLTGARLEPRRGIAIDVVAGPALAMLGTHTNEDVARKEDGATVRVIHHESKTTNLPRAVLATRVHFGERALRPFLGLEGEIGPRTDGGPVTYSDPSMPLWTAGLAFGASLGSR